MPEARLPGRRHADGEEDESVRVGTDRQFDGDGPTFVDLFSGVGGFSLGCRQAGLTPLAALDKDPEAIARYQANLGRHVYEVDLARASAAEIVERTRGVVPDVVVGGPPCQGFSSIGKRDPNDPRSELTRVFSRLVADLKPAAFAMENVPGILSIGSIAADIRHVLRAAGYANATWITLNAADFGVPQNRVRAFLLGSLAGAKPTADMIVAADAARVTVREALKGVPKPLTRSTLQRNAFVGYAGPPEPGSYDERMRSPKGAVTGCQRTIHEQQILDVFRAMRGGDVHRATWYRRLEAGELAPALRAGSRRRTACRPVHPFANRVITVREAARLHSFPDWFDFSDVVSLAHVQIGNSVPPLMAEGIAQWLTLAVSRTGVASQAVASA